MKLKKFLSVLALIILVGSDFLTSFSYALDDILKDSVVVQTKNEEIEIVENEEENMDENSEEENMDEEDSEIGEAVESTTGEIVEELTEEVSEIESGELEGLTGEAVEELTEEVSEIESGEIEGLTGEIIEEGTGEVSEIGSGELKWLTEETLEGDTGAIAEELIGEIVENIGTGEETIIEEIKYNEEPIIGEETYDNVIVRVEALSGIFPEGTELMIEPIKWGDLLDLKDKLVEEQEEIKEDTTIVAFDITFKYEGKEVQPKDGEKVKVIFDYSRNEDLVKADKNENQDVKVYHIEDKDEEGNKVAQGEEKIVDVTNKQESAENGIVVADAESFSIYALSLSKEDTLRTVDTVTVTHNPNAGVSYTLNGNENFTAGTITITYGTNTITMLDRNLGARAAGVGCKNSNSNCPSTDSTYGYYFQWGNNYGFDPKSTRSKSNTQVEASSLNYDPLHQQYFSSSIFIYGYNNWLNDPNVVDLWGGSVDDKSLSYPLTESDAAKRRGPCPKNFHVPSYGELNQVKSMMGDSAENAHSKLLIPFAGYHRGDFYLLGTSIHLWSSSPREFKYPVDKDKSYILNMMYKDEYDLISIFDFNRVVATPVRCFYDFYEPYTSSSTLLKVTFEPNNGDEPIIVEVESGDTVDNKSVYKDGFDFAGWYTGEDNGQTLSDTVFDFYTPITTDITLYAKWVSCENGEIYSSELGECVARWHELVSLTDDDTTTTVGSDEVVIGFPAIMTVTENTISEISGQKLAGELNIDFGGDAKFSHLVKVKIPVEGSSKAYVKVKHVGSTEYNYDGLTTNREASCDNGNIVNTDNIYHGEYINVESGYVSIYTCEASDFAAFGLPKVTFEPDNGSGATVVEVESGTRVNSEYIPTVTKDGYNFSGWYLTGAESAFDFSGTAITGNITLYAKWQEDEGVTYTVTFDANRGTFADTPASQNVLGGEHAIDPATLSGYKEPELPGYDFDGWWTEPRGGTQWDFGNDLVTGNITLYAHWIYDLPYGDLDVYMIDSNGSLIKYVMMDRNMGATGVYNKDFDSQNPSSFGFVYQWGNNYGFSRCNGNGTCNYSPITDTQVSVDIVENYIPSKFASSTWIGKNGSNPTTKTWHSNSGNVLKYLWGNANTTDRQGPCPDGYHVPLTSETNDEGGLFRVWGNIYDKTINRIEGNGSGFSFLSDDQKLFTFQFLLPNAGAHKKGNTKEQEQNICGDYWTATPAGSEMARNMWFCKDGQSDFYKKHGNFLFTNNSQRNNGSTLRCFKNSTDSANLDIVNGGKKGLITVHKVGGVSTINAIKEPENTDANGTGLIFGGWYTSQNFEPTTMKTGGDTLSASVTTLYAKWDCPDGLVYNSDNECISGVLVRFMDGETEYTRSVVLSGEEVSAPAINPIKAGHIFTGWFESGANLPFVFTGTPITGNLDLYAHWEDLPETEALITVNYYLKKLDAENNELTGGVIKYITGVEFTGEIGDTLNISGTYLTGIVGYQYDHATVFSGEDEILEDEIYLEGNKEVNMYYIPEQNQFILNTVQYSNTNGSSVNGMYYYGAKIILSGASSDDHYLWSGWIGLPEGTPNSAQTEFNMPNSEVIVTSSVREKTYNEYIVTFENWNGDFLWSGKVASGETPTYNGSTPSRVSTEQNVYTFDGWYPELSPVTGNITYTATYTESPRLYTVTLTGTPAGYGTLSTGSLLKEYGAAIVISGDKLTVGGTEVILSGNEGYDFQEWTGTCGKVDKQVCDEHIIYSHSDPIEFTGGNNLIITNPGYDLFSESNYQKDFEISFDIVDQNLSSSVNQATILNVKDEDQENIYPGIAIRKSSSAGKIEITATSNYGKGYKTNKNYSLENLHSIKISRINSILYVSINGSENEQFYDYSGFNNYFTKPIIFGSSYQSGNMFRPAKITLSNILIKTIDTCYTGNVYVVTGDCQMTAKFTTEDKYEITFVNDDGTELQKGIVASGTVPIYEGETPTKTGNAQFSYTFSGWTDGENEYASGNLPIVQGAKVYTATYTSIVNKYNVTIVSSDINSGTVSTGIVEAEYGTEITTSGNTLKIGLTEIVATPTSGTDQYSYTFSGWISDCNENILTGNCTFTGIFDSSINSYNVTGNVATGDEDKGYLNRSGAGLYDFGETLVVIAIPELGYLFDYWEVNGGTGENLPEGATASGNQLTIVVNQILDIVAHFTENAKTATINYYEMNTGGVYPDIPYDTDSLTGLVGEIKSINPESRTGFHLDNERSNTGVTITENNEDNIIKIYYARDKHYITLGYSGAFVNPNSVEVTPVPSESGYYYGENVHFEAIISTGYVFKQWRVNGNPIAGNADGVDFVIGTGDVILVIDGDPMNYRIDYYTEPGYSDPSNPNPDNYTILSGEIEIKNPIAESCYNFLGWTGGTTGDWLLKPTTGLVIDSSKGGDREYHANWERKSYEVTLSVDPLSGGTVTGAGIYRCMGTIELHATPNTGYHFVGWYDSIGNLISDNSMYVFYAPESDLGTGLTAKFEKNQYYITINKNGSGNFNGGSASSGRYYHDTPIMFDVSPNFGYKIQKWTKNGHDITGVNNEIYTGSILNITITETGDYEVYIIPETYNIIYIDGETILPLSPSSYTVENHVYSGDLPTITKDAYNFEGWYYENPVQRSNKVEELGEVPVNGKSVPIYAGWTPIDYNITYNLLSGETINWGEYYPYDFYQSYTVETSGTNLPTPQKSGYVFSGWMNHGEYISTFGGGITGNLDLYPTWNSDVMDIEVRYHAMDTNGQYPGEWSGVSYTGLTESLFTVPDYTTSGFHYYNYVYNGYTGYENPASFIVSGNNSANVIDVYYERERYFIERSGRYYQMPDATYIDFVKITPDNQPYYQYYYGEEIKIESIHPAYGWIFSGWYDATSEGKGFPSDEISLDSRDLTFHMPNHDVWVEPIMYHIPYILSFTGYEGAEITNLESCSYGTGDRETYYDYSECLPNLNKAGYWFNGWDDENGNWVRRLNDYSQEPILHRMPPHDYMLVANFEPMNTMPYEKYYYLQNVEGTGYTLSGDLTDFGNDGVTDQEMPERNPSYNIDGFQYSGFGYSGVMLPWEQRPYIKATGDNYINYYYDRKTYLVDVDYDNKKLSIAGTGEYRYEAPVTLTVTVNTGYEFSGFTSDQGELLSSDSVYNFIMPDSFVDIYADVNPIEYSIEYELDGGRYNPSWYENSTTYTIENPDILLLNPEKDGYKFLGWTGGVISGGIEGEEDIVVPTRDLIIPSGSIGNRKYFANFEATGSNVTVNYYLKKIDPENNVLTGGADEYIPKGVVYTGLTDSGVDIRSLYGTGIEGYEYTTAIVYGSDLSGGVETGITTILGDGSRVIDIYYTPNKYNFTLNSDSYSSTDGSSESTGYYFGATVTLSGDSNNDCFTWSGWTTSGITLSDVALQHTSFTMPANNVSVFPSVREKTYNIIFSGNGNTSGEMSPINGIRCTESTGLISNNFERDGYTFTGWSTTSGLNSREYIDGQMVSELSKNDGENVNLYAVWDVNWYTVTFDLSGGRLTGNMTLTTGYTIETPAILLDNYIPIKTGYNFSGWYKDNDLVNSIAGGEIGNYTLTAKWEAIPYTVYFNSASGTIVENQSYYYGDVLSDLDNAITTRTGYNFSGWYLSGVLYTSESTMPAENITLTAKWTPKTGTQYQVNHRGENIAGTEYDVVLSGYTMYGTSDSQTIAESGDFAGFTLSGNVNQKIIEPEGTTVIDIYYSRNVYSIILDNNGGTGVTEFTGKYQAPLIVPNPSKSGYEFAGWSPELPTTIPNYDYTGIAMWNPSTGEYKVEFYYQLSNGTYPSIATSGDLRIGMTEGTGSVTDADKEPMMSGYTFDSTNTGNLLEGEIVGDGSLILKVYFKKQFTVRYLTGSHGTFSEDIHSDLDYGTGTPAFRGNTGSHDLGYTFIGWNPELTETVIGDVDYIAQWVADTDILYSVEYYKQNLSGGYDILTGTYTGETNEKVTALVKDFTGFTFSGGNENNITSGVIAGDGSLVLKLFYDRNKYTITWKDGNSETLKTEQFFYGETPIYTGATPTKTATAQYTYTFNGTWTPNIENVTTGATYTAQFDETVNKYEIIFKDGDGNVIQSGMVEYGETPIYSGATPTKTATAQYTYTFNNNWTPNIENVTTGATYTAQFDETVNKYEIIFKDGDDNVIQSGMVEYGETPIYTGATPTKTATAQYTYTFNDTWSPNVENVTTGAIYTAQFDETVNKYEIIFKDGDDNVIQSGMVEYGETPIYSGTTPTKTATAQYTYTFNDTWTPNIENVTTGATYTAQFNATTNSYTVTIASNNTEYGDVIPKLLTGLYGASIVISGNELSISGQNVIAVPKGSTPQYTYTFSGWNNTCANEITGNCTITAEFTRTVNEYLIIFVDGNDNVIQSGMVEYGETPIYSGTTPTKTATAQYTYTFNNTWTPNIESVTTGAIYTAQFEETVNKYTISIVQNDTDMGTISTGEINVEYGSNIVESGNKITIGGVEIEAIPNPADVQYTYEFDRWTNTCGLELVGNCTIQANFKKTLNKYTITWKDDNGNVIDTTMVEYGTLPTHTTPTKPETEDYKYTFAGWIPELTGVIGNAEYTATFTAEEKEKHSEGGGMSGGGGRRTVTDDSDSQHGSAEEKSDLFTGDYYTNSGNVDEEILPLYEWAHENDITTTDIEYADPDGLLTRGHLAKMVVNFMVNILGRKISYDVTYNCRHWGDNESSWESYEIRDYATKACALGVMGINMVDNKFLPNSIVTRAEFGTVMSRVLWGDKYNITDTDHRSYYEDHLQALKRNNILTQIDNSENRWEIRKWVWLVFKRISEKYKK